MCPVSAGHEKTGAGNCLLLFFLLSSESGFVSDVVMLLRIAQRESCRILMAAILRKYRTQHAK